MKGFNITLPEEMVAMAESLAENFREAVLMEMHFSTVEFPTKQRAMIALSKVAYGHFDSAQQALDVFNQLVAVKGAMEENLELSEIFPDFQVFFDMYGEELKTMKNQAEQFIKYLAEQQRHRRR